MVMLLILLILAEKPNIYINLSSKSLRKLPLIDMAEKSPVPILLLNAAVPLKQSSEFFNIINIIRLSLHKSLALY